MALVTKNERGLAKAGPGESAELLALLYDAVLAPDQLSEAMEAIGRWMGADASHLIGWDTERFVPRLAVVDEGAMDHVDPDYVNHYSHVDPRRARMAEVPVGEVVTCERYFDEGFVRRNAFFQEYLIPRGRRHTLGAHLHGDGHMDFYVTFYHAVGREAFCGEQIDKARWLVPHLQRAVRLLQRQEALQGTAWMGTHAMDTLDHGLAVLDAQGQVVMLNLRAQALLRQGLWLVSAGGRLRPACGPQAMLEDLVRKVHATGVPQCRLLRRAAAHPAEPGWCSLTLLRLGPKEAPGGAVHPRAALLLRIDVPEQQRRPSVRQLMQLFSLTQAEARLAQALVQGQSADGYAQAAAVALPTVRTQIRALLDKTGAARQQDMVRLLAGLPAVRFPVGE